jgi:biotin-(acetyl-CoA carboxylase) ligase
VCRHFIVLFGVFVFVPIVGIKNAFTKWPNDCWIGDRKVCGMLIDNGAGVSYVGVGVNLVDNFQSEDGLDTVATSITRELTNKIDSNSSNNNNNNDNTIIESLGREKLLANVLGRIERAMDEWNIGEILQQYNRVHMLHNATIRVHHKTREESDERDYEAHVVGLAPFGMLLVRRIDAAGRLSGDEIPLSGEEVSIVKLRQDVSRN